MKIAVNHKKLGIMGGTFDPIHNGHMETAEFVYQQMGLEKVVFIPANIAPHKIGMEFAAAEHRYQMTVLATQDSPHFCVSDMEIRRKGISYTYDTVATLKEKYGTEYDLYFIIGADSVAKLDTWTKVRDIMGICTFVAATRPGFVTTVDKVIEYFGELGKTRIQWLNTPGLDISATDIRQRVREKRSIKGLVPVAVEQYIYQEGLYRS